jgi:hypothetical protein
VARLIGSAPAVVQLKGAESGELESGIGGLVLTGKLKLMGYEAQEVITVVNQESAQKALRFRRGGYVTGR